jgi:hypothetical protein
MLLPGCFFQEVPIFTKEQSLAGLSEDGNDGVNHALT